MNRWRDLLLVLVLFGTLIGFTIYTARQSTSSNMAPAGSTYSADAQGTYALRSWLQELGYRTDLFQYTSWALPADAAALLMLAPQAEPITAQEAEETLRWVREGGTLIIIVSQPAGIGISSGALLEALDARISIADADTEPVPAPIRVSQPVLTVPPTTQITADDRAVIELERDEYVPLAITPRGDVLVGFAEGQGYVYLGTSLAPFSNSTIQQPDNPQLVLNLLRRVPAGGRVLFDEYHHGFVQAPALTRSMLDYWWGRAALYGLLVTGLYLVLNGRRFGKPVPLPQDVARRSTAEYAQSLGTLFRRSGKRDYIAQHYAERLKRRIARAYGFVPSTTDDEFMRDVARYAAPREERLQALGRVLAQFRTATSDEQLAQAVRTADTLLDPRGRIRTD